MQVRQPHMPGAGQGNVAYRTTASDNPDINGPWLCNKGFDQHKWMARERLLQPRVDGRAATPGEAIARARQLLAAASNPAVLVSTHASNEELDVLQSLLGGTAGQAVVWYTGQFYALFFMGQVLKVDPFTTNMLIAWSLVLGSGGFVFFGWMALGVFGVVLQILARIHALIGKEGVALLTE